MLCWCLLLFCLGLAASVFGAFGWPESGCWWLLLFFWGWLPLFLVSLAAEPRLVYLPPVLKHNEEVRTMEPSKAAAGLSNMQTTCKGFCCLFGVFLVSLALFWGLAASVFGVFGC